MYSLSKRDNRKKHYEDNLEVYLLRGARARAKKQGVPCTITEEDISIPLVCPVLGIKLERSEGCSSYASPSLDKLIPSLGYVKGNVDVISHKANTLKSMGTLEEIQKVLNYMVLKCE